MQFMSKEQDFGFGNLKRKFIEQDSTYKIPDWH
jgi:hypothetical protein